MPYIPNKLRPRLEISDQQMPNDAGELNYCITRILYRSWLKQPRYITLCMLMGTLICVAFEFYRIVASSYEDQKRNDNGDVFK